MATKSSQGIIINVRNFMEKDRIVTILDSKGKRNDYVGKGSRSIKSRKATQIEVLNHIKFSYAEGRSLDILLEVNLIDSLFRNVEMSKANYMFYFSELLNKVYTPDDSSEYIQEIFILRELFKDFMYQSILKLQILMVNQLGAFPDLLTCQETEKDLREKRFFRENKIGYFAKKQQSSDLEIPDRLIKIQIFLSQNHARKVAKLNILEDDFRKLITLQNKWIECIIEKQINSFKLLF